MSYYQLFINLNLFKMPHSESTEYLYFYQGKITKKVSLDTVGAQIRYNKANQQVAEVFLPDVYGRITNFGLHEIMFGDKAQKVWKITLSERGETSILSIPVNSSQARLLIQRLPNASTNIRVKIEAGSGFNKEKGNTYYWLKMYHENNGSKNEILPFYTKDSEIKIPSGQQDPITGEWNFDEQNDFLEEVGVKFSQKFNNNRVDDEYDNYRNQSAPSIEPSAEDLEAPQPEEDMPF